MLSTSEAGATLGRRSGAVRQAQARAIRRLAAAARQKRDLSESLTDVQVLDHLADEFEGGDADRRVST